MATAGDTEVTLSWTVPGSDGGSAVTGYQYRYKTSGEFPDSWTDVPDGSDTGTDRSDERSYTVTVLDNGVEHTFEVRAVNVVGGRCPGLGHVDSGHRAGGARQSDGHGGGHGGGAGVDGSRVRRGLRGDRVSSTG